MVTVAAMKRSVYYYSHKLEVFGGDDRVRPLHRDAVLRVGAGVRDRVVGAGAREELEPVGQVQEPADRLGGVHQAGLQQDAVKVEVLAGPNR